jgi:type III pantothenate kinase
MLLAIDVGNTNIVVGVFDGSSLTNSWRIATFRERTADEMGILVTHLFAHRGLSVDGVNGVIIASVVPPLTGTMAEVARGYFGREPMIVEQGLETGMPVLYENPSEVGADRIVNGVAAFELYGKPRRRPVICVDFGTATTFDAISSAGEYLGGAICPGIQISADALFQRASKLPRVDVRKPAGVIGRTTVASMQAGLFYGYVAMVDGIVRRMRGELLRSDRGAWTGGMEPHEAFCLATGGMAGVIAAETPIIEAVDPDLTLHGLRIVWQRNGSGTSARSSSKPTEASGASRLDGVGQGTIRTDT